MVNSLCAEREVKVNGQEIERIKPGVIFKSCMKSESVGAGKD
jgi:hypothetical protein